MRRAGRRHSETAKDRACCRSHPGCGRIYRCAAGWRANRAAIASLPCNGCFGAFYPSRSDDAAYSGSDSSHFINVTSSASGDIDPDTSDADAKFASGSPVGRYRRSVANSYTVTTNSGCIAVGA